MVIHHHAYVTTKQSDGHIQQSHGYTGIRLTTTLQPHGHTAVTRSHGYMVTFGRQVMKVVEGLVTSWQKKKMYKEAVTLLRLVVRRDKVRV